MKNSPFYFTILIFSWLALSLAACKGKKLVELSPKNQVPAGLFAFNTGTSFYSCNPDNYVECEEIYLALNPVLVRFPGGLDANYYHLDGPGYGFRQPPDADPSRKPGGGGSDPSGDPNTRRGSESGSSDESTDTKAEPSTDLPTGKLPSGKYLDPRDASYPNGENVIGTFIKLALAGKSQVMFTCNMMDAAYEENKKVLDSLINSGVNVVGIELGNELYLKKYQDAKYSSPKIYLDTARYYMERLKVDFPGIKIGLVAAPSELIGINPSRLEYYNKWNMALAKANLDGAIIVHYYSKDMTCDCPGDIIAEADVPEKFDCANEALQNDLSLWFSTGLSNYKAMFPGKKMWLTEWNTTNRYHCYGNTQVNNLFFARYINELSTRYGDFVEFAVYHNWLGNGKHYPVAAWQKKDSKFIEKSPSPLFKLLQPIFSGRETKTIEIPSSITGELPKGMAVYGYYQTPSATESASLLFVAVNHVNSDHTLKLPSVKVKIGGQEFELQGGKLQAVYADELYASLGNPGFGTVPKADIKVAKTSFTDTFEVPGYGVCLAVFELK